MKNWLSTSYYYFSVVLDKLALFMILRKTYAHRPQGLVPQKLTTLIKKFTFGYVWIISYSQT